MSKNLFEKLQKVNSEKEFITIKMEYKGRVLHDTKIDLPEYAKDIIESEDTNFYYFFKDMSNSLEELITTLHKKKIWDNLNNGKSDGTDKSKQK